MATRTTGNIKNGASPAEFMQNKLKDEVLKNLEPELFFAKYGQKSTAPNGYLTVSWARIDQLTRTIAQSTLTEGVTPTDVDQTVTVVQATPVQYGMGVVMSDLLLKTTPVRDLVPKVGKNIAQNMMRIIDKVIQAQLITGTNVIYANNKASRATLASSDVVTGIEIGKATTKLRALNAEPISMGCYIGIVHSFVAGNIRNTANGLWLEANKYTTNETILNGELGKLAGVRLVETSNIDTVASTITVYPSYILGMDAYGVSDWQQMEMFYKDLGSSGTADFLNQRATAGAKVSFATKILDNNAFLRIESDATSV